VATSRCTRITGENAWSPMIFARQAGENTRQQLFLYSNVTHLKYQKIGSRYHEAGSGKLAA